MAHRSRTEAELKYALVGRRRCKRAANSGYDRRGLSMDKFDRFIANLDEFLVTQPYKVVGDANIGYWMALRAVRTAAHEAKCASQTDGADGG